MHEASFAEVIRVVLIILLIYFGIKLIFRWLGPLLLKYFLRKVGKKFEQQFSQYDPKQQRKNEGEVSIERKPRHSQKSNNDVGEYIDYEEID